MGTHTHTHGVASSSNTGRADAMLLPPAGMGGEAQKGPSVVPWGSARSCRGLQPQPQAGDLLDWNSKLEYNRYVTHSICNHYASSMCCCVDTLLDKRRATRNVLQPAALPCQPLAATTLHTLLQPCTHCYSPTHTATVGSPTCHQDHSIWLADSHRWISIRPLDTDCQLLLPSLSELGQQGLAPPAANSRQAVFIYLFIYSSIIHLIIIHLNNIFIRSSHTCWDFVFTSV